MTAVASREQILTQIEAVLATVPGIVTCARNRGLLPEDAKPAIIMLDGREDIVSTVVPQKSVRMPPAIFRLQPQIFVILQQRDDATNSTVMGVAKPIGPEISYWRDTILSLLINDPTLLSMVTTTGQIVFRGMETDMQTGNTMLGQLRLFIDFHYVWFPPG